MTLLTYLFEGSICMAIFFFFYLIALQKQTTFQLNRWYLLVTLLLSCIIPLIKIYIQARPDNMVVAASPIIVGSYLDALEYSFATTAEKTPIDWIRVALAIYLTGVVVFFVQFLIELKKLRNIILHAQQVTTLNHTFYLSPQVQSPFSFFEKTFFPANHTFTQEEIDEVMTHERAHMRGGPTWDILIVAVAGIFFWMNPVIYMYRRTLREVHEFLADAAVVKDTNWEHYASFLISQKNFGLQNQLSHQLVYSQLKNRLIMMTKSPSSPLSKWKYIGLIPLCLLSIILFSFREKADIINSEEKKVYNIYKDGLKVYKDGFAVWNTDTVPDAYIHSLRNVTPAEGTAALSNPPYTRSLPIFPGCENVPFAEMGNCGMDKLSDYINQHMSYPATLRKSGVEGKVIVQFIVGADGYIKNVAIEESLHPEADKIVLDVFNQMNKEAGKWQPAAKHGQLLDSEMSLPVQFSLENSFVKDGTSSTQPYTYVSEMPRFVGSEHVDKNDIVGSSKFIYEFVNEHLRYPEEEKAAGVEGMVIVQFIVREDGYVSEANIVRGVSQNFNKEVLRVIEAMNEPEPHWLPGRENGKVVPVMFTLPVKFKLAEQPSPQLSDTWGEKELQLVEKPIENGWLKVNPNPASDFVQLEILEGGVDVRITNMSREMIMWEQKKIEQQGKQFQIDVSNWPSGKYVIYTTKEGQLKMGGFIVMH